IAAAVRDPRNTVSHARRILNVKDAWGNSLRMDRDDGKLCESIRVWSLGADAKAKTSDDLSASRLVPRRKSEVFQQAIQKANDAIRDQLKI
ncbi:MAG: hypothetical protein AAF670_20025, partial [Planctomycetota bacterium]